MFVIIIIIIFFFLVHEYHIITGQGIHSGSGKSAVKEAIIEHLKSKEYW